MEHEPTEQIEYKGLTIKIFPDSDTDSPRDWDNLGVMFCSHGRYNLGDKLEIDPIKGLSTCRNGWKDVEEYLIKEVGAVVILPLYLYDHSGITISTTPFSCPWDSGQIGFIYVTAEKIRQEMGRALPLKKGQKYPKIQEIKHITKKDLLRAEDALKREVETYDQYLTGDVYGYIVEDEEGEDLDSCWGFYGLEECIEEAKSAADYKTGKIAEKKEKETLFIENVTTA